MRWWFSGPVRDVAGQLLGLEAADAVLEARRARDRPRPRERLRVALVGLEALRVGAVLDLVRGSVAGSGISHGSELFAT